MPHLTDAQRSDYARDGYLCPIRVMSTEQAASERAALEALEASPPDTPRPLSDYLRSTSYLVSDLPLRIATDPRVLDAVEGILGPDLLLWGCEYFIKEAGSDKIVSWHQDLTYWGMEGSDHEVTAWVALSPATRASGCMKFVPGSHRTRLLPHTDTFSATNILSRGQEIAVEVDEADAVLAELEPGEMSLHHGRLFHGSEKNTSDDRRIGLVMRYIRPDTPAEGAGDYAMLVRGADRYRHRINVCPAPGDFTPARLALYEEVTAAQAKVLAEGLDDTGDLYRGAAQREVTHG